MPLATNPEAVRVPLTFKPSLICTADESVDDIELTLISLLPVMVSVSPDTDVETFCVPAILNDSPSDTRVPVLSSPTNVMPCADAEPAIVKVSPDTDVVMEPLPAILNDSPIVTAVPDESSPTIVIVPTP